MADKEPKKVDVVKVKFPDIVRTQDIKKRGRVWRHSLVTTTNNPVCGENVDIESTTIRNLSAETVWIGDRLAAPGLNGNAFPLKEDDIIVIDKSYGEIYAATENGTAVLAILEE